MKEAIERLKKTTKQNNQEDTRNFTSVTMNTLVHSLKRRSALVRSEMLKGQKDCRK